MFRENSLRNRRHPSPQLLSPITTHHGAVSQAVPTPGVVLQQVWHSCSLSAVFDFAEPVAAGTTQCWPQSEDYSSSSSLEKARQPKNKEQLEEGEAHVTAREILTGLWILFTQAALICPHKHPKSSASQEASGEHR